MEYLRGLYWDLSCSISLSVTWRRRLSALSPSLQMTPNWGAPVNVLEGSVAFQRDLDRLEEWANQELMKNKCEVLYLGQTNPLQQYGLGTNQLGSGSAEQDLEVLVDSGLNRSQQCVLTARQASSILDCLSGV